MTEQSSRILIVDDSAANIRVLCDVLHKARFKTLIANTGKEAIEQIQLTKPQLVLLDVMMPGIDGFETCKRLKQNLTTREIPIIFMTALDHTQDKVRGFQVGAVDYITKPFQQEEVIARVTVHLKLHLLTQTVKAQARSLEKANQELQRIANLDGLTQIPNRRRFDEYLDQEWKRAFRDQQPLSLILCDVDYFKQYNDYYGHLAGDECLKQIALALQKSMKRPADLVARYGGEEFGVILPNTDYGRVIGVIQRIQTEIQRLQIPHIHSLVSESVTVSLGASMVIPNSNLSTDQLVLGTDKRLYEAKKKGRNTYCIQPFD